MSVASQLRDLIGEFYLSGTPLGAALEPLAAKIDTLENPTSLAAFDRATQQLLDAEPVERLQEQIAKLRVLFKDELERLDAPRPQARPA